MQEFSSDIFHDNFISLLSNIIKFQSFDIINFTIALYESFNRMLHFTIIENYDITELGYDYSSCAFYSDE